MEEEKNKKIKLKERNPYKYYRNCEIGCKTGKWISILAPFIGIFIAKFNDYFVLITEQEQVKLSLGCILALIVGGIAMWQNLKEENSEQVKKISSVVVWGIAFALSYLFQSILQDLTLILGCALIGQLVGKGFELGSDSFEELKLEAKKDDKDNEKIEKLAKALKEQNQKKEDEETPYE